MISLPNCHCKALVLAILVARTLQAQNASHPNMDTGANGDKGVATIRDGTTVEMRFAQAVVGSGSRARRDAGDDETAQADPGDKIRLVSAADVRVGSVVIINKGSIGQATVTNVKSTLRSFSSGIELRLDWIEDVEENKIPVRATALGPAHSVMIVVQPSTAGIVAAPESAGMVQLLIGEFRNAGMESIPAGTRIFGYVDGDVTLDVSKLQDISRQTKTPASLTIYAMNHRHSKSGNKFAIVCDGSRLGEIAPQQFVVFDIAPGQHTCQLHEHQSLTFIAAPGSEYFFRIVPEEGTLKAVSVGEGEDSVAGLEFVRFEPRSGNK
jgi:hypothetical protein